MFGMLARTALMALVSTPLLRHSPLTGLEKLVGTLLGLLAAILVGSFAVVAAVVAAVLWLVPPNSSPAAIMLGIALVLVGIALAIWVAFTGGKPTKELIHAAFEEPADPIDRVQASFHHALHAFRRGWENPHP